MKQESQFTRRTFLKTLGALGATVTSSLLIKFVPEAEAALPTHRLVARQRGWWSETGEVLQAELYAGFILLHDVEAPMPASVQLVEAIHLHGADDSGLDPLRGETTKFNSVEELRRQTTFSIYTLQEGFPDLQFTEASVTRYALSGAIWEAAVTYTDPQSTNRAQRITITGHPIFPRPYPVWPVHDFHFVPTVGEPEERLILPEKVVLSPLPAGVLRPSAQGHVLLWIEGDALYSLVVEHNSSREAIEAVAASLVKN